jgi:glycosyltransferase involved in cell wall biosynthesis
VSDKTKLLWHSNAPWTPTGYGSQTALFAERLKDHYDLTISAFYGLEGNILPWNGIPVLPGQAQTYGNETILEHAQAARLDEDSLVVALMDAWVLDANVWGQLPLACWVPVDHDPAPAPVAGFFHRSGAVPIAMSRFGEKKLREAGLDPLYVPHGVDTEAYKPHNRAEARKETGLPDDGFIVGMVAANKGNPSRKCFAEAFEAFRAFHANHPTSKLYVHAEATGRFGGVYLPDLIRSVDLNPDAVIFPDQYRAVHFPHKPEYMAKIYSSMDVLLAPSAGEGFGIPVIEAQACGIPVIVSDFSAQPELCGAGWLVEGVHTYTAIGSYQFKPSVKDIHEALKSCHRRTGRDVGTHARNARAHAEKYDVDLVLKDYMLPALEEARARYAARKPKTLKAAA